MSGFVKTDVKNQTCEKAGSSLKVIEYMPQRVLGDLSSCAGETGT